MQTAPLFIHSVLYGLSLLIMAKKRMEIEVPVSI